MKARTSLFLSAALIAMFLQFGCGASSSDGQTRTILLPGDIPLEVVQTPRGLWFGKYEVTQAQWEAVMGENPSEFKGDAKPVETVSWDDCQEFLKKLNAFPAVKESGLTFRLPTEEEWETACRAGAPKSEDYCKLADGTQITKSNLSRVAWFGKDWDDGPTEVGKNREPNAWGLYDMHGNVWEWTQTANGVFRVYRGGSFLDSAVICAAKSLISPLENPMLAPPPTNAVTLTTRMGFHPANQLDRLNIRSMPGAT